MAILDQAKARIMEAAQGKPRVIVAVAGPPGAGKSTVAEALADAIEDAAVLPMDGFHLDNDVLTARGLLHRKGAPQTFDTKGLLELLTQVRAGGDVSVPTFDRQADCVVPDGGMIDRRTRIVIAEGNYLLLQENGWEGLQEFWDLSVMIHVSMDELRTRLVQRWLDHGLSAQDALRRAEDNDLRNAETVFNKSAPADFTLQNG